MDKEVKLRRLKVHHKALESAYDKMITLLEKDMDTKKAKEGEGEEDISLRDSQVETFAKGVLKASEAADTLFRKIEEKEEEILKLEKPEEHKESLVEKVIEEGGDSNLNKFLQGG